MNKKSLVKGFTLIEIIFSMIVLGVIASATVYVSNSFQLTRRAQTDTQAQAFARSYFDNLKASWSIAANYANNALPTQISGASIVPYQPPGGFEYTVIIKDGVASGNPNIRSFPFTDSVRGVNPGFVADAPSAPVLLKIITLSVKHKLGRISDFAINLAAPA